jgi:hypothetical protein
LSDKLEDLLCSCPTPFIEKRLLGCGIAEWTKSKKELLDMRKKNFGWRDNTSAMLVYPPWVCQKELVE